MEDGNMATQASAISPTSQVTEEDMGKVREIFERGINALVDVSRLAETVKALQYQVDGLQRDVQKYRNQNDMLDEYLVKARQERDTATQRAATAERERQDYANTNTDLLRARDATDVLLQESLDKAHTLEKERDDAQFKVMEYEEKVATLQAKLDKFLSLISEMTPPPAPSTIEQPVNPVQETTPVPSLVNELEQAIQQEQAKEPEAHPNFVPWYNKNQAS